MGGGEGSAAREALKHKSMDKVVMCDIDKVTITKPYLLFKFSAVSQIEKLIISILIWATGQCQLFSIKLWALNNKILVMIVGFFIMTNKCFYKLYNTTKVLKHNNSEFS